MKLPPDFRDLLVEFGREGVEHVIIGGYAFAFHVQPRATKDLGVLLEGSHENLTRAARALAPYGAPENVVEAVAKLAEDEIAYLGSPPLRIDLLANKRAASRPQDEADVRKLERLRETARK